VVARTRRKEKLPKIVANFVYASSQGQRTHSARTNIEKMEYYQYLRLSSIPVFQLIRLSLIISQKTKDNNLQSLHTTGAA
jgi:hypothetical protein